MGLKWTDEFRQDAVQFALTSGLTRKQVADDLGAFCCSSVPEISVVRDRGETDLEPWYTNLGPERVEVL